MFEFDREVSQAWGARSDAVVNIFSRKIFIAADYVQEVESSAKAKIPTENICLVYVLVIAYNTPKLL